MYRVLLTFVMLLLAASSARTGPFDKDSKGTARVTGVLVFKEKLDFLPGTMIEVTIREEGATPKPEVNLGKQVIRDPRDAPIPFAVEYNPADVKKDTRYTVNARLFTTREMQYSSSPAVPVLTQKNPSRDLRVFMVPTTRRGETSR